MTGTRYRQDALGEHSWKGSRRSGLAECRAPSPKVSPNSVIFFLSGASPVDLVAPVERAPPLTSHLSLRHDGARSTFAERAGPHRDSVEEESWN